MARMQPRARGGEADSAATKQELYRKAQELEIPGRSEMNRDQLEAAVQDAELPSASRFDPEEFVDELPRRTGLTVRQLALIGGAVAVVWVLGLAAMALGSILWTLFIIAVLAAALVVLGYARRGGRALSERRGGAARQERI